MIEIVSNPAAKNKVASFLTSDNLPENEGFGTQAIIKGFEGHITSIDLVKVVIAGQAGGGIRTKQQGPQYIDGVQVAAVGEHSVVLSLVLDGGKRSVALTTLKRHGDSSITMLDGSAMLFSEMVGTDWAKLIDKRIKCTKTLRDAAVMTPRQERGAEQGKLTDQPTTKYEFAVIASKVAATPATPAAAETPAA